MTKSTDMAGRADDRAPANLEGFFAPSSVAFVGATEDLRKFGGRVLRRMLDFGYAGPIYPVNPKYDSIFGMRAYSSVSALPRVPQHVGISVPAEHVLKVLAECAALGVPFATVHTSGFSEAGTETGARLQAEISDLARRTGMRIMGPNCNGLASFVHRFAMTTTGAVTGPKVQAGDVGIIAQSGGLGQVNVMYRALEMGLGVSHQVSCGNQADLDVLDFAEFMVADPHTKVVLMVVESIGEGAKLRRIARAAAEARKPIVILKLGRSEAGRAAAASHTGALTGSDDVHRAAFRQFGLICVDDCNELNQMAMLLRAGRLPKGNRAAAVAASGGHAVLLADLGGMLGIEWTKYNEATQKRLNDIIPDFGQVTNPTDLTTAATGASGMFANALAAIAEDPDVDFIIPLFTINKRDDVWSGAEFIRNTKTPAAMLWTGKCGDDPQLTPAALIETGVPVFRDTLGCLKAMRASMDYAHFLRTPPTPSEAVRSNGIDIERARKVLSSATGRTLGERASRDLLAAYGFPQLKTGLAKDADQAAALAAETGRRVVLKIESPDILHKTDAGGVRLGIANPEEARAAYTDILEAVRRHKPDARVEGVLVQEMAPAGVELVLGGSRDATFGPVVTVGLGGIHVEVLRDIAHRVAPVTPSEARTMLRELKGFPILEGVRGMPPRDIEAVVDLIVRLSWLMHDFGDEIEELDINPLLALERGSGAQMLDALVIRPSATRR